MLFVLSFSIRVFLKLVNISFHCWSVNNKRPGHSQLRNCFPNISPHSQFDGLEPSVQTVFNKQDNRGLIPRLGGYFKTTKKFSYADNFSVKFLCRLYQNRLTGITLILPLCKFLSAELHSARSINAPGIAERYHGLEWPSLKMGRKFRWQWKVNLWLLKCLPI